MLNPNLIYSGIFLFVIMLYQLGWSDLYPQLGVPLLIFLILSICINGILGFGVSKFKFFKRNHNPQNKPNNAISVTVVLSVLWMIDKIFNDIPTFHIILITFTSFYSSYVFSIFLLKKERRLLLIFIVLFLLSSLLATFRILIFYNLITYLLTYIYIRKPLKSLKGKIIIIFLATSILYIFGYLGNNLKGDDYNSGELILKIGQANNNFTNSVIPKEFFWTYLYASSPLANLELNIENNYTLEPSFKNFILFINSEFLPDFISGKIFDAFGAKQIDGLQVNSALNVSTIYLKSYRYFGWYGLALMGLVIAIFPIVYLFLIRNSSFFISGLISLTTIYIFLVFDNLFVFSALSFQLIYPILDRLKLRLLQKND